jgi:hypothetical protein
MGSKKALVGAAGLAAALGIGGAFGAAFGSPGISGALQSDSGTETTTPAIDADAGHRPFGEHLAVAADLLGMSEDELATALEGGSTIASLATDRGVDPQSIIDAIVADSQDELAARVTAFVNGDVPDHGPGGPGGPGHHGGPGFGGEGLDAAATALGITDDDLRTQIEGGATIASIAETAGIDVQTVIDAMVADATTRIDEAEAAGRIDAARATEIRDGLTDRITALVNGELPTHGPGGPDGPPDGGN